MRAAIYARYSSENQREVSIEDQSRICADRAARDGWTIIATYADREISAATPTLQRPGGRAMLTAAGGDWDILIIEGLDRCWRDIVDQERTIRKLEFAGVRIVGASDGYDSRLEDRELQRGVRGLLNQQYLRDLGKKTHRGQTGQVLRGYHAGGMPYGYRPVRDADGSKLQIDEAQAAHVRWIFARYAEGWSVQRIAFQLNQQRAPSPRGRSWAVSAIYGSPAKGTGVLNNVLYAGRYIWNRSQWVKDPETGVRKRVERPEADWRIEQRPELRIIDEATWQAVRERIDRPRLTGGRGKGARPSTLFGGLLTCGCCGGSMIAINRDLYGCAARKDRGPAVCSGITSPRDATDSRLLSVVRDDLLSDAALAAFQLELRTVIAERARARHHDDGALRRRDAELEAEIRRLVDAIAVVGISPAITERLRAAEAERQAIARQVRASKPVDAAKAVPDAVARYRRMVLQLERTLEKDKAASRTLLAELLGEIRIRRDGDAVYADFQDPRRSLMAVAGESLGTVAGGGFSIRRSIRLR